MLLYTPGIEFIFVTKRCSYRVHNYASFIKESRLMFRRSGDSSVLYLVYGLLVPSQRKICIIHGTRRIDPRERYFQLSFPHFPLLCNFYICFRVPCGQDYGGDLAVELRVCILHTLLSRDLHFEGTYENVSVEGTFES